MAKNPITPEQFFVLRTPRLPLSHLTALNEPHLDIWQHLKAWLGDDKVKLALYIASPSLLSRTLQAFEAEIQGKTLAPKQKNKLQQALLKYYIRMASRPTPFGLFSGINLGELGDQTKLISGNLDDDNYCSRLDMFYLNALRLHVSTDEDIRHLLKFIPNPSYYIIANQNRYKQCRYIETYQSEDTRQYRLSAIELDEYSQFVLETAKGGISFATLNEKFLAQFSTNPEEDAEQVTEYLQGMIDESLLVPDLPMPLTGIAPDNALLRSLQNLEQQPNKHNLAQGLQSALQALQQFDASKAPQVADLQAIAANLKELPVKVDESKLFQSDVYRHFEQANIAEQDIQRLKQQLLLLQAANARKKEPFREFINQFNARFEGQFVPLNILLDDESGIGFSHESGYESLLLAGLGFVAEQSSGAPEPVESILNQHILNTLSLPKNAGLQVLRISSKELQSKLNEPLNAAKTAATMPASFGAIVNLYIDNKEFDEKGLDKKEQPLIRLNGTYGPSAGNLLGRFSHLNEQLNTQLTEHYQKEQAHNPDVIFAEVVHMPEGRPGNVIARPHLRPYEIVFLADSSLAEEHQITLDDLYAWVEGGEVKLWSKRLNKQIVPRLSSAHNYSDRSLSIYKFLCMLQQQKTSTPSFRLPNALSHASFAPRIMLDNLILSVKQWHIPKDKLTKLVNNGKFNDKHWHELKDDYQLDDVLAFAISDNVLTIDMTNPAMVEVLLSETDMFKTVELKEVLHQHYQTPVKNSQGQCFENEVIIPFFNQGAKPLHSYHERPSKQINNRNLQRRFAPGSNWLSLKIYSGNSAVESLLANQLLDFINKNQDLYQQWFFIRYGDPLWHIRLRFKGEPTQINGQLLPAINELLAPMITSNELHKVELTTYEQEVERYGGPVAIDLVEQLFMFDSQLIAETMALIDRGEFDEDLRLAVVMHKSDQLLEAFGCAFEDKLDFIGQLRASFGKEFNETAALRKQCGQKYQQHATKIAQEIQGKGDAANLVANWLEKATVVIEQLKMLQNEGKLTCSFNSLLGSLLHMHNNRMFKSEGRRHEFLMHDFLRRYYFSLGKVAKQ